MNINDTTADATFTLTAEDVMEGVRNCAFERALERHFPGHGPCVINPQNVYVGNQRFALSCAGTAKTIMDEVNSSLPRTEDRQAIAAAHCPVRFTLVAMKEED